MYVSRFHSVFSCIISMCYSHIASKLWFTFKACVLLSFLVTSVYIQPYASFVASMMRLFTHLFPHNTEGKNADLTTLTGTCDTARLSQSEAMLSCWCLTPSQPLWLPQWLYIVCLFMRYFISVCHGPQCCICLISFSSVPCGIENMITTLMQPNARIYLEPSTGM